MSEIDLQRQINELSKTLEELRRKDRSAFVPYIPDAMVADFNGLHPYNRDYSGVYSGRMGELGAAAYGAAFSAPVFRKGKFGKAIQLADAATNKILNPSFEANTGGSPTAWTVTGAGAAVGYIASVAVSRFSALGNNAFHLKQVDALSTRFVYTTTAIVCSGVHTLTVDVTLLIGSVIIRVDDVFGTPFAYKEITTSGRHYLTFTGTGADYYIIFQGPNISGLGICDAYFDCVQLEAGPATPYTDGSLGPGNEWTGTANNSTTNRRATYLIYPSGVIERKGVQGSIMAWFQFGQTPARGIFDTRQTAVSNMVVYTSSGNLVWRDSSGADLIIAPMPALASLDEWHHVAFTWDFIANAFRLFYDGSQVGEYLGASTFVAWDYFAIGSSWDGSAAINGLCDNLVISSRVVKPSTIASLTVSNAPAYSDDADESEMRAQFALGGHETIELLPLELSTGCDVFLTVMQNSVSAKYLVSTFGSGVSVLYAFNAGGSFGNAPGTSNGLINVGVKSTNNGLVVENDTGVPLRFAIRIQRQPFAGVVHP